VKADPIVETESRARGPYETRQRLVHLAPREGLQPRMATVDGLDVETAPHAFTGALGQDFVGCAQLDPRRTDRRSRHP